MAHEDVAGGVPSGQAFAEGRWIVFEDESGAALAGVVRRTWGQRGVTPVIKLNGARGDRENMVAFVAYRPGSEPRLLVWHKSREGYTKEHFPLLLTMLHARLGGPVTLLVGQLLQPRQHPDTRVGPGTGTPGYGSSNYRRTRPN